MDQNDFEEWLFVMDDELEKLFAVLPSDVAEGLDFGDRSLELIEAWLLESFESIDELRRDENSQIWGQCSRYVGEVARRAFNARWSVNDANPKLAFYRTPVVDVAGYGDFCPTALVSASLDRRTGRFIATVFRNAQRIYTKNG